MYIERRFLSERLTCFNVFVHFCLFAKIFKMFYVGLKLESKVKRSRMIPQEKHKDAAVWCLPLHAVCLHCRVKCRRKSLLRFDCSHNEVTRRVPHCAFDSSFVCNNINGTRTRFVKTRPMHNLH